MADLIPTKLDDIAKFARESARPFTQFLVTIGFVIGMFFKVDVEIMGLAASLLAWHGYLRTQDKKLAGANEEASAPPA